MIIRTQNKYSSIIVLLSFFFSLFSFFYIYNLANFVWFIQIFFLSIAFFVYYRSVEGLINYLNFPFISPSLFVLLRIFSIIILFLSSLHGLFIFLTLVGPLDISFTSMIIIVSSFLFAGSSLGLFQRRD